ncbi:MAG: NUDIX domain-containing protein [Nocardioidaceae bacterium]
MIRTPHPSLPGELADGDAVVDRTESWPVLAEHTVYAHRFLSLALDTVRAPDGETFERVYVRHQGGVGIVALDDDNRVLLLEQYRHPARTRLVELPAGVLDRGGEEPRETAARELAEETDLVAREWSTLLRMYSSPGSSDEQWHVYLARGLSGVPDRERFAREHEEAHMDRVWVPLRDAVGAVLTGEITDAMAVSGLLAAWVKQSP